MTQAPASPQSPSAGPSTAQSTGLASYRPALALVLLVALGWFGWELLGDDDAQAAPMRRGAFRVPVTTVRCEAGEVVESVALVGDVLSRQYSVLGFERSGRVDEVLVDIGDVVVQGQTLARLNDAVLDEQYAVAVAGAAAVVAEADYARLEADRARELGVELVRKSEQDRLSSDAVARGFRSEQSQAEVRRLAAVLALGELSAPFDGVITQRHVTLGSYVNVGQPAFDVVDLEHREVRLEIPAPVAATLQVGAAVTLSVDELPGFSLDTRLHQLVPAANPATRQFIGVVSLDGLDAERRLLPGLFARARVVRRQARSDTVLPSDAVRVDALGARVVVVVPAGSNAEAPTARMVPVRVLAEGQGRVAVEPVEPGALGAGDVVVVTGIENVTPGAELNPVPTDPTDPAEASPAPVTG